MPTYGEKWRAESSACETGHVPRSCQTTFLRLDSTGEISSVANSCQPTKTRVSCTPPREINGNMITMKNWVTSSMMGVNGLRSANNFTNSGKSGTSNVDFNANILDRIAESMPVTAANMNPNMPKFPNNVLYPQGGIPGWNYPRPNFGVVNGGLPTFPCHQFNNPFGSKFVGVPHQGKMEMYACPEYLASMGKWTQPQMMEDHHWHQRHRKFDRAYRGHAPKHHKHDHAKHDKKTFPSEQVPSKCHGKGKPEVEVSQEKSESSVDALVRCKNLNSEQCSKSSSVSSPAANIGCDIHVKSDQSKPSRERRDCDQHKSVKIKSEPSAQITNKDDKIEGSDEQLRCKENQDVGTKVTFKVARPCESHVNGNEKGSDSDRLESNLQVLFVRKNWKKGRPSASKQRRRKLHKAKSSEPNNSDSTDSEKVNDTKAKTVPNSDRNGKCHGTMSFILGLSQSPTSENQPNSPSTNSSFVLSFSDDDDDDDDDESDFDNDAEWEAEFSNLGPCGLFNFIPQSNSVTNSPINFQVQISPVQSECNLQEKTMDDINSTWNIQISVLDEREKCNAKTKTKKKVHFPEDKNLSVVHPMVTWAYAYQEARKGHWEKYGRDNDRFKRRVADLKNILNPVLSPKHRKAVYVERFQRETI